MNDLIKDEISQILEDWDRPISNATASWVRVVALGHPVRVVPGEGNEPAREVSHLFRQKAVYAYVFEILRCVEIDVDYDQFKALLPEVRKRVLSSPPLSKEERDAAESFAWKVLRVGWNHALTGFPDHRYISLRKEIQAVEPAPAP